MNTKLENILNETLKTLNYEYETKIVKSNIDGVDFQCDDAFKLAKIYHKAPFIIAEEIVNKLKENKNFKEYFKDVAIQSLEKSQLQTNGILSEAVIFDCLSLWYEEKTIIYTIEPQTNEIRWNFCWDSRFTDYDTRNLQYINQGHVEAPIYVEIDGQVVNPKIELYVEGELYQTVEISTTIAQYEKLLYDSRENQFSIERQNTDGTTTSLFSLDYIDCENDNVIRLPKNRSCEIRLTVDNEVLNAKLTIYPRYKAV